MKVWYRAQALADIDQIYLYLKERSPGGAAKLLRAIYAGIHLIAERPHAWPQTDDRTVRVKIVRRYHYKIFYSVLDEHVEILHVRHTARVPWI
jgi:toxin ParE1/3/4